MRAWMREAELPLHSVESVLSELAFLLGRDGRPMHHATELVRSGAVVVLPLLDAEAAALDGLMRRHADVPMSLAHACLVRLSELNPDADILSFDADFSVYRRFGREPLPLVQSAMWVNEAPPSPDTFSP